MKKLYFTFLAMITCLCYSYQANAAVANITEYKMEFLKNTKDTEVSCKEGSGGLYVDAVPNQLECTRTSFRGRYDCYRVADCQCINKKAIRVVAKNKKSVNCYCGSYPLSECKNGEGAICEACPDNAAIKAAGIKEARYRMTCDTNSHWVEKRNSDGVVVGCRCDAERHWVQSGNKCVCDDANGWVYSSATNSCVAKQCPNGYSVNVNDCDTTWHSIKYHASAKSGGQTCKKCELCTVRGAKTAEGGLTCECNTSAGYMRNTNGSAVCVCDTVNGWTDNGVSCVASACPEGTSLNITCTKGKAENTEHRSGGQICQECVEKNADCAGLGRLVNAAGNCYCDTANGWEGETVSPDASTDCTAAKCPTDYYTQAYANANNISLNTSISSGKSGGEVCYLKKVTECTGKGRLMNSAGKCYCDTENGWEGATVVPDASTDCTAANCPEGYYTERYATANKIELNKYNTNGKSGGEVCYLEKETNPDNQPDTCGDEYIYDCCPAGEKCTECGGKYATTGECDGYPVRINGVCTRWSDACINYERGKGLKAQYVMSEAPENMNSAGQELHEGDCAVDYESLFTKPATQQGCKTTGAAEVNEQCVQKHLENCQERIDTQVSHWLSECATDMGMTEEEVENANISDAGYGTENTQTDCCAAKGYTLASCPAGATCDSCNNGTVKYKVTTGPDCSCGSTDNADTCAYEENGQCVYMTDYAACSTYCELTCWATGEVDDACGSGAAQGCPETFRTQGYCALLDKGNCNERPSEKSSCSLDSNSSSGGSSSGGSSSGSSSGGGGYGDGSVVLDDGIGTTIETTGEQGNKNDYVSGTGYTDDPSATGGKNTSLGDAMIQLYAESREDGGKQ